MNIHFATLRMVLVLSVLLNTVLAQPSATVALRPQQEPAPIAMPVVATESVATPVPDVVTTTVIALPEPINLEAAPTAPVATDVPADVPSVVDTSSDAAKTAQVMTQTGVTPSVVVRVYVDDKARNNKDVKVTLAVQVLTATQPITVQLSLPVGADYVAKSSKTAIYDSAQRTLTWRNLDVSDVKKGSGDTFKLSVNVPNVPVNLALPLQVLGAPEGCCQVQGGFLAIGADKQSSQPLDKAKGGTFKLSERVTVDFAPEALKETVVITGVDYAAAVFTPTAPAQQGGKPVPQLSVPIELGPDMSFDAPVTVTVELSDVVDAELMRYGLVPVLQYLPRETTDAVSGTVGGKVEIVPSTFDPGLRRLTAVLKHFSTYQVTFSNQVGAPQPWKLSANFGSVSLFRGSANYGIGIAGLPLADGLQPNLSVNYSSAAADGGAEDVNKLGAGWSMEIPYVRQNAKADKKPLDNDNGFIHNEEYTLQSSEDYQISLGGSSYYLLQKTPNEFVAENNAAIKAVRCAVGVNCYGIVVPAWLERFHDAWSDCAVDIKMSFPVNQTYWQVWSADGTRYVFGTDAASTQRFVRRNDDNQGLMHTWYLRRVYSPSRGDVANGTWTANYDYSEYFENGGPRGDTGKRNDKDCAARGYEFDSDTKLDLVTYAYNLLSATVKSEIAFNYAGTESLNSILVKSNGQKLRQYEFVRSGGRLSSVLEKTWSSQSLANPDKVLPAPTFTYGTGGEANLLKTMSNGYGATVSYAYFDYNNGFRSVQTKWMADGLGNTTVHQYEHSGPCYNTNGSVCRTGHDALFLDVNGNPSGALMGFGGVKERIREGSTAGPVLAVATHNYELKTSRLGMEKETRQFNTAETAVIASSQTTYLEWVGGPTNTQGLIAGQWFVSPQTVKSFPTGDVGGSPSTQTDYEYDRFGNATRTTEHGFVGVTGDERSTTRGYINNTSSQNNWMVSKLAYERVFTGTGTEADALNSLSLVRVNYDGSTTLDAMNQTLTKGQTTRVVQLASGGYTSSGGSIVCVSPCSMVSESYAYDALGNVSTITDTRGFTTTAAYDTSGQFLTRVTNALGHKTEYVYNGVNQASGVSTSPYGLLLAVREPNSDWNACVLGSATNTNGCQQNSYAYDAFGRLKQVQRQDGIGGWSVRARYAYYDGVDADTPMLPLNQSPFVVTATTYTDGSASWSKGLWTRTFYDGLGRAVQTQTPHGDWSTTGGNDSVVNTRYDALSRPIQQSLPNLRPSWKTSQAPTAMYDPPNWSNGSLVSTTTTYDALSRVSQVTAPDGTFSTHSYSVDNLSNQGYAPTNLLVHFVTDANKHSKNEVTDGLGRMVKVREMTGTCYTGTANCSTPWTKYAETSYDYDVLGRLLKVTDGLNNQTTMTYDKLGRKMGMSDPDMGVWNYTYDAGGNLITQKDAKNQTLWFNYDKLNRQTEKRMTNSGGALLVQRCYEGACGNPDATFKVNAVGRLVHVQKFTPAGVWDNSQVYFYDARGRTNKKWDQVNLPEANPATSVQYETKFGYDQADRVTTMTYPDNEVVTTGYNAAGQPNTLGGTSTYVSGATYNQLGASTQITYGNGQSQRMYYFGSNLNATQWGNSRYGRLRQVCVLATSAGECADDNRAGATPDKLNMVYSYDNVGNVFQMGDRVRNETMTYGYDDLDRLKTWTMNGAVQEAYDYNVIGNMTSKNTLGTMSYNDPAHKHALTHITAGQVAEYDGNGNMTRRWNTVWYRHDWNVDNKMTTVKSDAGAVLMTLSYDADGARVKTVAGSTTTVYVGNYYEVKDTPNEWVNVTFAKTVGVSVSGSTLTRNAAGSGWGSSGASSTAYCAGGGNGGWCAAYASAAANNTNTMYGLSNIDTNADYTSIRYGLHLQSSGNVQVYEMGVYRGTFGSYAAGDRFSVQAEGDNKVRYYKLPAGSSNWQLLYTSTDTATYPLRMDSALYESGAQLVSMQMYGTQLKTVASYYSMGGARVAMRTPTNGLQWLHSDHLGSASLATDASGAKVTNSEQRYKPFGEVRLNASGQSSKYTYTGQYDFMSFGMMDYGARMYSPLLGRFLSADTVVPGAGNPQAFNRYAYVGNNPLNRTDPTGHYSPEQVEAHVRANYGDGWESVLGAWRSDQPFWEMLMKAGDNDTLLAPTTSLGSGSFRNTADGSSFTFNGSSGLERYQGYGPYSLRDLHNKEKLGAETVKNFHIVDSGREATWRQPLYTYTSKGAFARRIDRIVKYQYTGNILVNPFAGDGLPWFAGVALGTALPRLAAGVGLSALCPVCGVVVGIGSAATVVGSALTYGNNAVDLEFALSVSFDQTNQPEWCPSQGCLPAPELNPANSADRDFLYR